MLAESAALAVESQVLAVKHLVKAQLLVLAESAALAAQESQVLAVKQLVKAELLALLVLVESAALAVESLVLAAKQLVKAELLALAAESVLALAVESQDSQPMARLVNHSFQANRRVLMSVVLSVVR